MILKWRTAQRWAQTPFKWLQSLYVWAQTGVLVLALCGVLWETRVNAQGIPALSEAVIDYATSGDHTLIAGATGKRIRVYRVSLFCNAANNIIFKDSTPTTLQPVLNFTASQGFILDVSPFPWYTAALGMDFVVNLSASQQCSGHISYTVS